MNRISSFVLFTAVLTLVSVPTACAQRLLGNSFDGVLYDIDIATGAASNPRSIGTGVESLTGIAFSPDGILYGLTGFVGMPANTLISIDPASGTPTSIGSTGLFVIAEGDLVFDPTSGILYGIQDFPNNRQLFTLDVSTGAGTVVGDLGSMSDGDFSAMTFAPDGTLYILDTGDSDTSRLLTVDKATAAIINSVDLSQDLDFTAGMDFNPVTGTLYVADGGSEFFTHNLYTIDPTNGALTFIGPTGLLTGLAGLAFAIPEPAGVALASVAGLIALAMRRCLGDTRLH